MKQEDLSERHFTSIWDYKYWDSERTVHSWIYSLASLLLEMTALQISLDSEHLGSSLRSSYFVQHERVFMLPSFRSSGTEIEGLLSREPKHSVRCTSVRHGPYSNAKKQKQYIKQTSNVWTLKIGNHQFGSLPWVYNINVCLPLNLSPSLFLAQPISKNTKSSTRSPNPRFRI